MGTLPWPAANARLVEVNAPGTQDDAGDVTAPGAAIWTGSVEAWLRRDESVKEGGEVLTTAEMDVLVVRKPPAEIIALKAGDQQRAHTVLVEDRRGPAPYPQIRWHVVDVANRARGKKTDSLRLVLRDPREEEEGS